MACSVQFLNRIRLPYGPKVSALNVENSVFCLVKMYRKLNNANVWHKIVIEDAFVKFHSFWPISCGKCVSQTCTQCKRQNEKQVATKWIWFLMMHSMKIVSCTLWLRHYALEMGLFPSVYIGASFGSFTRCVLPTKISGKIHAQYTAFDLLVIFRFPGIVCHLPIVFTSHSVTTYIFSADSCCFFHIFFLFIRLFFPFKIYFCQLF